MFSPPKNTGGAHNSEALGLCGPDLVGQSFTWPELSSRLVKREAFGSRLCGLRDTCLSLKLEDPALVRNHSISVNPPTFKNCCMLGLAVLRVLKDKHPTFPTSEGPHETKPGRQRAVHHRSPTCAPCKTQKALASKYLQLILVAKLGGF